MGFARDMIGGQVKKSNLTAIEGQVRILRNTMRREQNTDRSQDRLIKDLQRENQTLKLYLATVIRLLVAKEIVSEDEFERLAQVIDAEDGSEDGRMDGKLI